MSEAVHERIKAHLERVGTTDEAHVQSAIDAHEAGVDVEAIIADIQAGVPHWLALLRALGLAGLLPGTKHHTSGARAAKKAE